MMWIDAVSALCGHVYSQSNKCYRKMKRTFAVGARRVLHPGRFLRWIESGRLFRLGQLFWWIEDERWLIRS